MSRILTKSILKDTRVTNINKPSVATGYNNGITQEQFVQEVFKSETGRTNWLLFEDNITAGGQTQVLSQQLNTKGLQIVTTVTVADDGVLLPKAIKYMTIEVLNTDSNDLTVYPVVGEYLDTVLNGSTTIASNTRTKFLARSNGQWITLP